MKRRIILTVLIFSITNFMFSQITAETSEGDKVELNKDGTWDFVKEEPTNSVASPPVESIECSDVISTTEDEMTGKKTTAMKETLIISENGGKSGLGLYLMKSNKSIILSGKAVGAGSCIDDDDKMNILFRDGTRVEIANNGDFNCKASFTVYFGGVFGNKKNLELLKEKEIEKMRIWTSDGFVEKEFSQQQSKELLTAFNCLDS
jgi:hypothetical protein